MEQKLHKACSVNIFVRTLKQRNALGQIIYLCAIVLSISIANKIAVSLLRSNLEFQALQNWKVIWANTALFFLTYTCGLVLVQIRFCTCFQFAAWTILALQTLVWWSTLHEFFGWVGLYSLLFLFLHLLNGYFLRNKRMTSPLELRNQARKRCYAYFHGNIRKLPVDAKGEIVEDLTFVDSDIDAFRHACVSGIFTMEYGKRPAQFFGWLNEFLFQSGGPNGKAMDIWNNRKGREAAKGLKSEKSLFKRIEILLKCGELIVSPKDVRLTSDSIETNPLLEAGQFIRLYSTRNRTCYFELGSYKVFSKKELVELIKRSQYPNYSLRKMGGSYYPIAKADGNSANNLT